uniref:Molybdate-anion transporter n=1 Tax=Rhizochromulina marina TaxID=1034831 RepID=A0A7S2RZF5_9STRA|mmetsp:Transcript_23113/g.67348  ORF Transcript_23113/g.67348 Transcript_23113/m.67348 type:complete len:492 (+) Transcript_23113:34-1509(+)
MATPVESIGFGEEQATAADQSIDIPAVPPLSVATPYLVMLGAMVLAILAADRIIARKTPTTIVTREFKAFQQSFLHVHLCALGAEYLQDSHLFAVLLRHGHSVEDVASLYAASFTVSYLFGVVASYLPGGAAGILGGRRSACMACFILYATAALSVYHDDYGTLLLGRFLYGMGTALMHTVFDAWMRAEHMAQAFPEEWLVQTYQVSVRYTTAAAIGAGLASEVAATYGDLATPFLLSVAVCGLGLSLISRSWKGTYERLNCDCAGLATMGRSISEGIQGILALVNANPSDRSALHLVVVQACFEACIYIALFMWTPTLQASAVEHFGLGTPPPYGIIFAMLMAALMLGSHTFRLMSLSPSYRPSPETVSRTLCIMACAACLFLAIFGTSLHWWGLGAFLVFEFCVGLYYPAIGGLRGKYVPYESQSLVAQLSKSALAILVLSLLLNFSTVNSIMFLACSCLLGAAVFVLYHALQEAPPPSSLPPVMHGEA